MLGRRVNLKKLLVFSQFFYPDQTGTGKVLAELFSYLARKGFAVTALSSRQIHNDSKNTILAAHEIWEKVEIHRVFKNFKDKNKALGRIFNYLMFFIQACFYTLQTGLHKNKDILISVSNPPIMPLLPAILKGKRKFIYLIHDLYPDIAIKMGATRPNSLMAKVILVVNNFVFLKADKIIVLGRDMKQYLIDNYLVNADKIVVLTNWAEKVNCPSCSPGNEFQLIYSGNMGKFHSLEMLLDLAVSRGDIKICFIGAGAQRDSLQAKTEKLALTNVEFSPFLEQEQYLRKMQQASAFVVSLEKNLTGLAVPSKFYTYLSLGKPIICISEPESEMAQIVIEADCGFVVAHGDLAALERAIAKLLDKKVQLQMAENAKKVFVEKYEKTLVVAQYEKLLESL